MESNSAAIQSEVYAIKLSNYQFKLASSESNAQNGTALDFNSHGTGNYHKLEMGKKNEKTIITVDGIIQSPVNNTKIQTKPTTPLSSVHMPANPTGTAWAQELGT